MILCQFYVGVVEDRNDHLNLGRCKVRVAGLHTHDKTLLPTEDLPWAHVLQPVSGGNCLNTVAPREGTVVGVQFMDYPDCQIPIVVGILNSIPQQSQCVIGHYPDDHPTVKTMGGNISVPKSKIVAASFKHGSLELVEKKPATTAEEKLDEKVTNDQ